MMNRFLEDVLKPNFKYETEQQTYQNICTND